MKPVRRLLASLLFLVAATARAKVPPPPAEPAWPGEELPLPLAVRTPEDMAFKALAERQFLEFNLLTSGKLAWDKGDYATAAAKWEALLRLPNLPADLEAGVRPFAVEARKRAGGHPGALPQVAAPAPEKPPEKAPERPERAERPARKALVAVRGTVTGGGAAGPGGTVIWLERTDGPMPKPKPARAASVKQRNKSFAPHVVVVPVGTEVSFLNEDPLLHDVFSLSKPNDFDLGLYEGGSFKTKTFDAPGPVQLLCNIHASMLGWVYVVPSPYYALTDAQGTFTIKGVPPGEYALKAWHEAASRITEQKLTVGEEGASTSLQVGGDVRAPTLVPDKYGKMRQTQLGY